jgi:uncharacterized membrane protein YccC
MPPLDRTKANMAPGAPDKQPAHIGKVKTWLAELFALNTAALNWPRGVMFLDVALVPLVVFWAIGHEQYLLSSIFAAFLIIVADPGGAIGPRTLRLTIFALTGAGVTALGFGLGTVAWGWLVLAAFLVTLVAGLAVMFGVHVVVAALLLNVWFIIAIAVGQALHSQADVSDHTWAQVAAWAGGSALWIAVTFVVWLVTGRRDMSQPFAEIPADTARRKLTRPVIAFSVLRALAIAGAFALEYGLNLSHGYWLPIATIVALKPSLHQSTVMSAQRVIGALIGAIAAGLLLLIPSAVNGLQLFAVDRGLEVVAIVLFIHAVAIRTWNYALYTAAVAAAVLTLIDLLQPTDYSAEGYRVAWTLAGVAIGVSVMLLAGLLSKRTAARKA